MRCWTTEQVGPSLTPLILSKTYAQTAQCRECIVYLLLKRENFTIKSRCKNEDPHTSRLEARCRFNVVSVSRFSLGSCISACLLGDRCRAGCISACLLGDFSTFLRRICLVGRLRCSPLDSGVFLLDVAYVSRNTERYEI